MILPRLRAPSSNRPSMAASGGSAVLSVAMCAGPARSIGAEETSGESPRTQASTSGSSGIGARAGGHGDRREAGLRLRLRLRGHGADAADRGEGDGQEAEAGPDRADPDRRPQAELGREDAAD